MTSAYFKNLPAAGLHTFEFRLAFYVKNENMSPPSDIISFSEYANQHVKNPRYKILIWFAIKIIRYM